MWTPNPFYFDYGRPFPAQSVQQLFLGCHQLLSEYSPDHQTRVYEPGSGTGRILVPLARQFPGWSFVGSDMSADMNGVLNLKIVSDNLSNVTLVHENAFDYKHDPPADIIVVSSLLHAVKEWKKLLQKLVLEDLAPRGIICLIGERADIYDCALGRAVEGVDDELARFWQVYRETRRTLLKDDLESSQVGSKWELQNDAPAEFLLPQGFFEIDSCSVSWVHNFRLDDLARIVEERCYSSMFLIPATTFGAIAAQVRESIRAPEKVTKSRHEARVRCFARA